MDSNGTRFLALDGPGDFGTTEPELVWDTAQAAFTLAQRHQLRLPGAPESQAESDWRDARPLVLDGFGQLGRISADGTRLEFALSWAAGEWQAVRADHADDFAPSLESLALDPVDAPPGSRFVDLHLGGSGLAALPYTDGGSHGLLVVHLRERWQARCALSLAPLRAWVDADDAIWVAGEHALALCRGRPLPHGYRPRPERFEPRAPNPHPLRQHWLQPLAAGLRVRGLAGDAAHLYLLARADEGAGQLVLRRRLAAVRDEPLQAYPVDPEVPPATDIAAVDRGRLALLAPRDPADPDFRLRDCPVVTLEEAAAESPHRARLVRERYPLRSPAAARFVGGVDAQARYLAADGPRELHRLAQARYPARATGVLRRPLDSLEPDTLWHRLYLEACIPPGCRIELAARVTDDWEERGAAGWDVQPAPLWQRQPSELPYAPGRVSPVAGRQGLFEVLLQRSNGPVRELRGRYLQLRVTLSGDGRHSPAIHALRVWFPRHSWQQAHLPQHFHQQERPPARTPAHDAPQPGNGADFRERLLASLEGMLSPLEERIAAAEIFLRPEAAPAARLPALAATLGTRLPEHWPEARRRRWLARTGELQRRRGTLAGLALALDIATDGLVAAGHVVPVENFRLRRTLATLLGLDLSDDHHPLTLGTGQSGNSIVGESLILAEDDAREFLALFAPELATGAERRAVETFFDRYGRRLTVVLHAEARRRRATVEAVLAEQAPATVQWVVRESDHPFVPGLSPLLGIDTLLRDEPPPAPVVLDESRLGRGDLLRNPAALSPEHARPRSDSGQPHGDRP